MTNRKWTEESVLIELKKWIEEGKWKGAKDLQKNYGSLSRAIKNCFGNTKLAFKELGLEYNEYTQLTFYTEAKLLNALQKWINEGKWKGAYHFSIHNPKIYNHIYKKMGMEKAFEKLGLNYDDFKKKKSRHRGLTEEKGLEELYKWIQDGNWKGVKDLERNYKKLFTVINRMGFEEAFQKINLNFKDYEYTRKKWNEKFILTELKGILDRDDWKGPSELYKTNRPLAEAIAHYLSFPKAFEQLGLNYTEFKKVETCTSEKTLSELKKYNEEGKWKGINQLQKDNLSLLNAIRNRFSFEEAFEKIGLNYQDYKQTEVWSKEKTIMEFKKWYNEGNWNGRNDLRKRNTKLHSAIRFHSSFEEVFSHLGFRYEEEMKVEAWDEEKIVSQLSNWVNQGNWQEASHLKQNNSKLYWAIYRRLGMHAAFEKIGLNYDDFKMGEYGRKKHWNNEKIANELKKIIEEGQWKGVGTLKANHSSLYGAIERNMGFVEAFKMIGINYCDYKLTTDWTEEKILKELKQWIDEGKWKGMKQLMNDNGKLHAAVYVYFGYEEAFKRIGLNYSDYKLIK